MLKIGITGGIGSGKTIVCKVFEILGVPVFYADMVAKNIMQTDGKVRQGVIHAFGSEAYLKDGNLNRKYIAGIVFKDEQQLEKLNSIVHPAVFDAFDVWSKLQKDTRYIIKEAALLFESGSYKMCDRSVLIKSPESLRIQRIMMRDGSSAEEIRLRMSRQFTDDQKELLSDHVLHNDEIQLLVPQILELHAEFENSAE